MNLVVVFFVSLAVGCIKDEGADHGEMDDTTVAELDCSQCFHCSDDSCHCPLECSAPQKDNEVCGDECTCPGESGATAKAFNEDASALSPMEAFVGFTPLGITGQQRDVRGGAYLDVNGNQVSSSCASDRDSLWFCAEDIWLAGENRHESVYVPEDGGFLGGTDLGYSVRLGKTGRTFLYMGDSFGTADTSACGAARPERFCNDAILTVDGPSSRGHLGEGVPRDQNASNGIEVALALGTKDSGEARGFWPLVVDGINGRDPLPLCEETNGDDVPCLGKFSVPTGAVAASLPTAHLPQSRGDELGDSDVVLLLYGAAIAATQEETRTGGRRRASSFLTVSTDGLRFSLLGEGPFSRDKFIIAAMVLLPREVRRRACLDDEKSPLCQAALGLEGDAVLMLGAGQPMRRSPLHLALMRLSDLRVFYYRFDENTGVEAWSTEEGDATPVIDAQFGEVGLSLVTKEMCPPSARNRCKDRLLLLANQGAGVTLRHAPLSRPGARARTSALEPSWSRPMRTSAAGYGPFVIDDFTRVVEDREGHLNLEAYHVISSWDGKGMCQPNRNPYGVFTRPLKLIDTSTCQPLGDGKRLFSCQDALLPWPLELD
ncbi:MAG: hypothetical protein MUC50_14215 [Myxococcota bacterium]|jgi:hypothetical protein|nr:hypothetical protein [Myxococcota bacterium]